MRQGVDPQPIAITWKGLPTGITGSEGVMIPADQNEVEVTLTAAADAPIATTEVLMIEAVTTYGGREVRVVSPPAKLEVIAP